MIRKGLAGLCLFAAALPAGCGSSARHRAGAGTGARAAPAGIADVLLDRAANYRIPSASMEPTLAVGDRVAVQRAAPELGAIVIFHPPEVAQQELCGPRAHPAPLSGAACSQAVPAEERAVTFVKRVVAGPGDRLYIRGGHVFREAAGHRGFVRERDGYIRACGASAACNYPVPVTVAAGHWYLLGDNRGESDDSRFWGAVPGSWILGRVTAVYVPPDRARSLPVPSP